MVEQSDRPATINESFDEETKRLIENFNETVREEIKKFDKKGGFRERTR